MSDQLSDSLYQVRGSRGEVLCGYRVAATFEDWSLLGRHDNEWLVTVDTPVGMNDFRLSTWNEPFEIRLTLADNVPGQMIGHGKLYSRDPLRFIGVGTIQVE
jgi:hypothetical protein